MKKHLVAAAAVSCLFAFVSGCSGAPDSEPAPAPAPEEVTAAPPVKSGELQTNQRNQDSLCTHALYLYRTAANDDELDRANDMVIAFC